MNGHGSIHEDAPTTQPPHTSTSSAPLAPRTSPDQ